jgi:hypothetical protein
MTSWARYSSKGYEVSSKGDTRFSPLFAELPDGRTIEEAYQLDVKGYRAKGVTDWRKAKGKKPLRRMTEQQLYNRFLLLWAWWAWGHKEDMAELKKLSKLSGGVLTDCFASTNINQARALAQLIDSPVDPLDF